MGHSSLKDSKSVLAPALYSLAYKYPQVKAGVVIRNKLDLRYNTDFVSSVPMAWKKVELSLNFLLLLCIVRLSQGPFLFYFIMCLFPATLYDSCFVL